MESAPLARCIPSPAALSLSLLQRSGPVFNKRVNADLTARAIDSQNAVHWALNFWFAPHEVSLRWVPPGQPRESPDEDPSFRGGTRTASTGITGN